MAVNFTVTNVKSLPDGTHGDSRTTGLYLQVRNGGKARSFLYRHEKDGKKSWQSLGSLKVTGLAEARDEANRLRLAVRKGEDIKAAKAPAKRPSTFREDTLSYFEYVKGDWKSAEHAGMWWKSMENHAFPAIGDMDTATVTVQDITDCLKALWVSHNDTASRILGRIRSVLDHAISQANGNRQARFPHGNVALSVRLPKGHRKDQTPHRSIAWQDAPTLCKELEALGDDIRAKGLRFLLLCCAPRAFEVTGAKWSEIDGDVFHVPGERMKSGKARDIPLSAAALELLATIPQTGEFIFPGRKGKYVGGTTFGRMRTPVGGTFVPFSGHMHRDGMCILLRDEMKVDCDVHGMRATFRGWVSSNNPTLSEDKACELCLDHVPAGHNQVRLAYDRGDMLAERRELAEKWSRYLLGA